MYKYTGYNKSHSILTVHVKACYDRCINVTGYTINTCTLPVQGNAHWHRYPLHVMIEVVVVERARHIYDRCILIEDTE